MSRDLKLTKQIILNHDNYPFPNFYADKLQSGIIQLCVLFKKNNQKHWYPLININ
jgi:hypothetical protein